MPVKKKPVELTDIETQEVSLVDKAANKRKWVVRKAAGAVMKSDGKGGFVPVDEPATDASAAPEASPETAPEAAPTDAVQVGLSKATKGAIQSTIDKLTAMLSAPDADEDAEGAADLLAKALDGFEPEPELNPASVELLKKPAELAKAATGAAMKLLEVANALNLSCTEETAEHYPYEIKWKISTVLDALTTMASLEREEPAAAAVVASAVHKSEEPTAADTAAQERLKNVALSLQKSLYSELHTSETTDVNVSDAEKVESLLENATTVIKSLKAKVDELESRPQPSNVLSPEVETVKKSKTVWASDMAAVVAEEERASRK